MKIKNIKINAYGKLHDVDLDLKDNINIIYGKNESGKSTILKFILNSFYGASKNKKGKDISDFEKYKPWDGQDFSGKLKYELDNGNSFEIYREFNKKNPKIFNENLEDISKEFNIDKNKGNDFFYEQTKVDEDLFLSTCAIMQQETKIEKNMQSTLIQKVANLVGTGDDTVSFRKAIDRINRRQLDEVGSERSREKPINAVCKNMDNLQNEKEELEKDVDITFEIEREKQEIEEKNLQDEIKNKCIKEIQKLGNETNLEKEKIKIQENIKNKNIEKINLLKNRLNKIKKEEKETEEKNKIKNKKKNKKTKNNLIFIFAILILFNIIQFFIVKNKIFNYIFLLTVPTYLIFYLFFINKIKNKKIINSNNKNDEINNIENEINILEKNKINLENEINNLKNKINLEKNKKIEEIKNNYLNKIEINELNNLIFSENIDYLLEKNQNEINNNKIKLHTLDLDKKSYDEKIENLAKIEEELSNLSEQYVNLKKINSSMELAKEALNISYEKMKNTVTPKFTANLSETISKLTNRKIY